MKLSAPGSSTGIGAVPARPESIRYLVRPEGRLSYTDCGSGALIVCVPGMGDLRGSYRELVSPLVDAGYRVVVLDLRGHGDSDTTFREYGDVATAADIIALIDELGGPAVVIGNSMAASSAAWAAAERPDLIAGLVSFAPFLREPASSRMATALNRVLFRVAFARPWGALFWTKFYGGALNAGARASWLPEHLTAIHRSLRQPGRLRSLRHLALALDHSVVERRVAEVRAPHLAFIGALDPDFADQSGEVAWLKSIGVAAELVEDSGHYAHTQRPDITVPATIEFLAGIAAADHAAWAQPDA